MEITKEITKEELPKAFLTALNGELGLTPKELDIASYICGEYDNYRNQGIPDTIISKLVFGMDGRKALQKEFKLSSQGMYNVLKAVTTKGILQQTEDNFALAAWLVIGDISIKFKVTNG